MPGRVSSQLQKLDFTEKLIEKGKRESADALLKKLKVGRLYPDGPGSYSCGNADF
jgi:hypothetical protein